VASRPTRVPATCACRHALDSALITAPDARDPAMIDKLRCIAGRVLPAAP
jgi:5'-methylthioadenosine phosphorylase